MQNKFRILFAHCYANLYAAWRMTITMHKPWGKGLEIWKVCTFRHTPDDEFHDVWLEEHITQRIKFILHVEGKREKRTG